MTTGRYRLGGLTASAVRFPWWRPRRRRAQSRWVATQRENGMHITMHPAPTLRSRVQRHAFDRMVGALDIAPGALVPGLREWPARALVWALLNPAGRSSLRHRFGAWSTLPGDRWSDFTRMVDGVVVDVPRPGTAVLACATREALYVDPHLLDAPVLAELGRFPMYVLDPSAPGGGRVTAWRETVDLRQWWPA